MALGADLSHRVIGGVPPGHMVAFRIGQDIR